MRSYKDLVEKGKVLVLNYESTKHDICMLTAQVISLGVSLDTFSKDIGMKKETLLSWYRVHRLYVIKLLEINLIDRPSKLDYQAITLTRKLNGSDMCDEDFVRLFKYYRNQDKHERKLTNSILTARVLFTNMNRITDKSKLDIVCQDLDNIISRLDMLIEEKLTA